MFALIYVLRLRGSVLLAKYLHQTPIESRGEAAKLDGIRK